jgi:signal transduction histidine kinase
MKFSLRTKFSVAFFSMALVLFLFISVAGNYFIQVGFKEYTVNRLSTESEAIVSQITKGYSDWGQEFDVSAISSIGSSAMERGLILRVEDSNKNIIWDATVYDERYCSNMLSHMQITMLKQDPNFKGSYIEKTYDLIDNSEKVGLISIGYYGPYYFNDNDVKYIEALNKALLFAGILALIISIFLGAFFARRLTKPIKNVINASKQISLGDYNVKVEGKSNTKEISELAETINNLGTKLETQENLRKRLSTDIAHELRTPITTLQSHMELMIEGIWEMDKERLKGCYDETIRLGNMVSDLSKIAQLENENLNFKKTLIDVNKIVESVIKVLEGEFFKKNIKLSHNGTEAMIMGDSDKMKQVFMNLISNALKYSDTLGEIKVNVEKNNGKVAITINDNGIGIPKEDLPFIFERFYRVDKSRTRNTGGTGIGLAITKALVEAQNGTISVESIEGKGSSFIVEFPEHVNHV